jgi:DNA invertase Pin-like site-specific DNA recombinase
MLERQREGNAEAKADGKYKERAPTARAPHFQRRVKAAAVGAAVQQGSVLSLA